MTHTQPHPAVLQVVGYKNSGKTTLAGALIRRLRADGLSVAAVKHDGHDFEIDRPGTDSWSHAEAGADWVAITSKQRTAWIAQRPAELDELIALFSEADVVIIEGFKTAPYPKLVLLRDEADLPLAALPGAAALLCPGDWRPDDARLPVFSRNDTAAVYRFVQTLLRL